MMSSSPNGIDLDAYFERIGYAGPTSATLDTLRLLQARHTTAIAFENLDPLLRRPVSLDLDALARKLVTQRRGGYCFEQNTFFRGVLERLGFSVVGQAALVQWNRTDYGPRIHMVLRVELNDGPYFVDVGFGGLTLTSPLRLDPGVEQQTTLEPFRVVRAGPDMQVQIHLKEWKPVYQVSSQEVTADDYAVYNWFTSTHPDIVFTQHLMAARPTNDRRYALSDNELSIHHLNGPTERRRIATAAELMSVLREHFEIEPPEGTGAVLERLIALQTSVPSGMVSSS